MADRRYLARSIVESRPIRNSGRRANEFVVSEQPVSASSADTSREAVKRGEGGGYRGTRSPVRADS